MRKTLKILSLILSVVLFMGVFSAANPALAAEVQLNDAEKVAQEEAAELVTSETEAESDEAEAPTLLYEDESRRDEYTKHFVMSDGTVNAVMYPEPVHYKGDENKKWEEIDNTLEYDKAEGKFKNKANKFKVEFDKDLSADEMLTIENEGYTLSWKYKAGLFRGAMVNGKVEKAEEPQGYEKKAAHKTRSKFKFNSFESESDLEYVVTSTGIKENIILKSKYAKNSYTFVVDADGLTLTKKEDGSISAVNENEEEIFLIPAPFMYDSNNVYSYDVEYNLSEKNNGKYEITVVADEAWLQSEERAYPVVVDPVITTKQKKSAIATTFVASGYASTNMNNMQDLYIGVESANYKKCRTLVKFALPSLNKGDMVVQASLAFYMHSVSFYTSSMPDKEINVHKITQNWDASTVKWNNQPTYDSVVTDYNFIERNPYEWKYFDVTKTVKEWYEGKASNYGFLIKSAVETGDNADVAARGIFWSDKYNSADEGYPVVIISYRNNKGLESYWSCTASSVGSAGTAYVDDYTGNLVFELPLAASISELAPVTLSAYYNTYCAGQKVTRGNAENDSIRTTIGRGWRLNYQQTVLPSTQYGLSGDSAEDYPYVYTDGDGTEHYFRKVVKNSKTTYEDEDGLGLTLTVDNEECKYIISTKQGSKLKFNSEGNLGYIYDSNGNCVHITYKEANNAADLKEKQRINRVYDGAGHYFQFSYHTNDSGVENDYVRYITDNAGRRIRLTIPGGYLSTVTYPDATATNVSYEPDYPTLINYIKDNDGYALNFDYKVSIESFPVTKIKEYGTNEDGAFVAGQVVTLNRELYNTTIIRSSGVDGIFENDDDVVRTYQFDDFGRKTGEQVQLADGSQVGAGNATYINQTGDSTSNIRSANNISSSAGLGKNVANFLKDSNGDAIDNWHFTTNNTGGMLCVSNGSVYYGDSSVELHVDTISASTGRAYMRQDITNLIKGKTYTFSVYTKVESYTKHASATDHGAYLAVRGLNGSELTGSAVYSTKLCEVTNSSIDKGFRRLTATITLPNDATGLRVYAGLMGASGVVCFDGMQVEAGSQVNPYNFLYNSSFEVSSSGLPAGWEYGNYSYKASSNGTVLDGITKVTYKENSKAIRITGSSTKEKYLYQLIPIEATQNDTYIVSGWGAANAANDTFHNTSDNKAKFEILVTIYYEDSNGNTVDDTQNYSAVFNTTISGWQYSSKAFNLQFKGHSDYVPYMIRVMPRYKHQVNHAYFDHIQLIKDVAQSYVYDSEGNLVTVSANAEQKNNMEYDGENNLKTYKDALGNKTTFSYESKTHNLKKSTSPTGITTTYGYTTNGNHVKTVIANKADELKVQTSSGYTLANGDIVAGAYLRTSTDQHGYSTVYDYDYPTGAKKSVTDVNGNVTTYNYDKDAEGNSQYNRLLGVSSGNSKVGYAYSGNQLESITFGDETNYETYSFSYDVFGNVLETKVGSQALSTSEYAENNGVLQSTEYGNGSVLNYVYDEYGNTTEIVKDMREQSAENSATEPVYPKTAYSWSFNSSGVNTSHSDFENNKKYLYSYDSIGRLIRQEILANDTSVRIGATEFQYDLRNNLTKLSVETGGRTVSQGYNYKAISGITDTSDYAKENLPTRYSMSSNRYIDYSYDTINRLNLKALNLNGAKLYTNYLYNRSDTRMDENGEKLRTTQLGLEIVGNIAYNYEYDRVGNITTIHKGVRNGTGSTAAATGFETYRSYEYDGLNQLIRESDASQNKTFAYEYDIMGNITNKTVSTYPLANFEGEPVVNSINYTYGNDGKTSWNKLLTSVDLDGDDVPDNNETITYDAIGNPITYLGANLEWFGRQLQKYTKGSTTVIYTYDANGLRGSKTVNGVKSDYLYLDGKLVYEKKGDVDIYYNYDSYGNFAGMKWYDAAGTAYALYALTNAQGDVLGLYNGNGELKIAYTYDTWGKVLSETDAQGNPLTGNLIEYSKLNPFRYRGYYYDSETGLYYLQSRYYNPEIGRFLNADGYVTTGQGLLSYNMFAYCLNNPVMFSDPSGDITTFVAAALVFIGVCVIVGGILGAFADEKLIQKSQDATENKHKDKLPKGINELNGQEKDDTKSVSKKNAGNSPKLSKGDRAMNIFIGATLGLAVGGSLACLASLPVSMVVGISVGAKMFSIGALAFNAEAIIFAPFYSVELDPIEWCP